LRWSLTILNIVGVIKLVLGKKIWMTWELDLGNPETPQQRYFTEEQLKQIIETADGQHRVLFALLAGTGIRIGEAGGLHIDDLDLDNCVVHVRVGFGTVRRWHRRPRTLSGKLILTAVLLVC
jgi:integrase